MSPEVLALGLIAAVHVVAMIVLFAALPGGRGMHWWPTDEDSGGGGGDPPPAPPRPPEPPRGGDGLPLPDAVPAGLRLRGSESERLGERERPSRRPAHPPVRPERVPSK